MIAATLPAHMDGRACVLEMLGAESRHWAQDEWRGWYFEHVALPALVNAFGGGPIAIANTTFDYSLDQIWDLKCHGDDSQTAILNSTTAVDECLSERGVGVLVLSGTTLFDRGEFREWHRRLRVANGKIPRPRTRPATSTRRSKPAFIPKRLDTYFIADLESRDRLLAANVLKVMKQGRQTDGSPRGPKYMLDTRRAEGSAAHLAHVNLSSDDTSNEHE